MKALLVSLSLATVACTSGVQGIAPRLCPVEGMPRVASIDGLVPARPDSLFLPPLPPPLALKGKATTTRVFVDSTGVVIPDSTIVCGVTDLGYASRMANMIAQIHFAPGRIAGRAVGSYAEIHYHF